MKKALILATIALTAALTACTDERNAVAPSFENEPVAQMTVKHMVTSCKAATDENATISYDFVITGNESKLTRTYHHDFTEGAEEACTAVKKNAANNEEIICTYNAVELVSTFNNLTIDDYNTMVRAECMAQK